MNLLVSVECHLVFAASLPPRLSERPVEEVADCLIASRGIGKILVEQSFLLGFPDNLLRDQHQPDCLWIWQQRHNNFQRQLCKWCLGAVTARLHFAFAGTIWCGSGDCQFLRQRRHRDDGAGQSRSMSAASSAATAISYRPPLGATVPTSA